MYFYQGEEIKFLKDLTNGNYWRVPKSSAIPQLTKDFVTWEEWEDRDYLFAKTSSKLAEWIMHNCKEGYAVEHNEQKLLKAYKHISNGGIYFDVNMVTVRDVVDLELELGLSNNTSRAYFNISGLNVKALEFLGNQLLEAARRAKGFIDENGVKEVEDTYGKGFVLENTEK